HYRLTPGIGNVCASIEKAILFVVQSYPPNYECDINQVFRRASALLGAVFRLNHLVLQDQKHGVRFAAAWRSMPHGGDSYPHRGSDFSCSRLCVGDRSTASAIILI